MVMWRMRKDGPQEETQKEVSLLCGPFLFASFGYKLSPNPELSQPGANGIIADSDSLTGKLIKTENW